MTPSYVTETWLFLERLLVTFKPLQRFFLFQMKWTFPNLVRMGFQAVVSAI